VIVLITEANNENRLFRKVQGDARHRHPLPEHRRRLARPRRETPNRSTRKPRHGMTRGRVLPGPHALRDGRITPAVHNVQILRRHLRRADVQEGVPATRIEESGESVGDLRGRDGGMPGGI